MGTGVVDYHPILRAATGLKHYFIEQEEFVGDTMTELREDAEYMRKLDVLIARAAARNAPRSVSS